MRTERVQGANIAWGPRQVRGDRSNCQIVRLPVGPAQSEFSDIALRNEFGDQRRPAILRDADSPGASIHFQMGGGGGGGQK